jgi:hypothetical protein
MTPIERAIETVIFNSRWILAPFYLGLIVSLLLLFIHFARLLIEFVLHIHVAEESQVILGVLGLIDATFTANLIIIVIFSGYENFVSRLDAGDHDKPEWMAKVDFGGLKQKADDVDRGDLRHSGAQGFHESREDGGRLGSRLAGGHSRRLRRLDAGAGDRGSPRERERGQEQSPASVSYSEPAARAKLPKPIAARNSWRVSERSRNTPSRRLVTIVASA